MRVWVISITMLLAAGCTLPAAKRKAAQEVGLTYDAANALVARASQRVPGKFVRMLKDETGDILVYLGTPGGGHAVRFKREGDTWIQVEVLAWWQ
jgi:hypothetical protein